VDFVKSLSGALPWRSPTGFLAFALMAGAWNGAAVSAAQPQQLEQAVKASFLFKFAPFVEWPASALGATDRAFTICISGEDPFGQTLNEVVRGQRIAGRSVEVRRLADGAGATGCQILFAGRSGTANTAAFTGMTGQPVLTVSDRKTGISGAMIQFVMQNGRVRFQIDDGMAKASGLTISSKLLGLAVAVERK
jgi:hypothetical protein